MNHDTLNAYQRHALQVLSCEPRSVGDLNILMGRVNSGDQLADLRHLEHLGLIRSEKMQRRHGTVWASTPAGEELAQKIFDEAGPVLRPEVFQELALSVCCALPITSSDIVERLLVRGIKANARTIQCHLNALVNDGNLRCETVRNRPRYALTRDGEVWLDSRTRAA